MARPRTHDLEAILDAAEELAVTSGAAAVTVRALSESTSMSNGAIYHAFGSRAGLVGRAWLRAAQQFLAAQREAVDAARLNAGPAAPDSAAVAAVIAAADAPAAFLLAEPVRGRFLLSVARDDLLGADELPAELADRLRALDAELTRLFVDLAQQLWGRGDRTAVAVIRDCIVELPTALLLRGDRSPDPPARHRLAAAVGAVLSVPLPPVSPQPGSPQPHPATTPGKDS
ncbi:putative TetR family transcriptional regulator [Gordonia hirsuta DSM 44140 = NBRC 16056]|uniref:Putative TetR family transcriptional regulator n=1 Tax=Gordonia hirsuta DSM 44140 = NBRC 16056 TaxID=1121927 RepID=L7LCQ2_9ACTN|nr:TetR/AcrR family transcriptional regulator [Gordonia hirsuta]GAC58694.1 putative TetR family transcriptional regulator [Gordonia hirsuta DSM 44140 = NBRC 16056]